MSDPEAGSAATYYAFRPSLVGAPWEFLLHDDALEWRRGTQGGRVPYRDIRRVRLGFRPVTLQNYRFITEIWTTRGPKLSVASTSWRGVVEQERHDAAYTAFVSELHHRIMAAAGAAEFRCGSPVLLYWPGVVVFAGLCLGVVLLGVQAVHTQAWLGFAVAGAMLLYFLWQTGTFFWRNQPGRYEPDALPARVMP